MSEPQTTRQWMFYHDGAYGPATEAELRDFGHRLSIHSDAKGMAATVMEQMWDEIDELRARLDELRRLGLETIRHSREQFDGQ